MDMKKIICESTYFYGVTEQSTYAYRLMLRFCDPIEEAVLQKALSLTVKRYPYYMVQCISDGREYWLVPNDRPFDGKRQSQPLSLGGQLSGGYSVAEYISRTRRRNGCNAGTSHLGLLLLQG